MNTVWKPSLMATDLSRLPHAPGRLPLLGDVTSVDRHRPTQHEMTLSRDLGPIFQRKLLNDRLVIVAGSALANECTNEDSWARALLGPGLSLRKVADDGLFTARTSDPAWGRARRVLTPAFTQDAMRVHHQAMLSVADDLRDSWTNSETDVVDVTTAMTHTTLEVIARAGFSMGLGLFGDQSGSVDNAQAFLDALGRTLVWASESTNDLPLIGHVREAFRQRQLRRDIATVQSTVDQIIEMRTYAGQVKSTDLLDLMLSTADPETGELLDHNNVRNQILTFLVAGHETTASLLETTLFYVAQDAGLQGRLRTEAATLKAADYAYTAVAGLRDIRATLNEVLRLWPPLPGLFRVSRRDQTLGGYHIPAGRAVFVLALAAQRDPTVWGDSADDFDPFRAKPTRNAFFRPWGIGPRSCIGRAFAFHEATLLIAHILNNFELSAPAPAQLNIRERGALRPEAFQVKVASVAN